MKRLTLAFALFFLKGIATGVCWILRHTVRGVVWLDRRWAAQHRRHVRKKRIHLLDVVRHSEARQAAAAGKYARLFHIAGDRASAANWARRAVRHWSLAEGYRRRLGVLGKTA